MTAVPTSITPWPSTPTPNVGQMAATRAPMDSNDVELAFSLVLRALSRKSKLQSALLTAPVEEEAQVVRG